MFFPSFVHVWQLMTTYRFCVHSAVVEYTFEYYKCYKWLNRTRNSQLALALALVMGLLFTFFFYSSVFLFHFSTFFFTFLYLRNIYASVHSAKQEATMTREIIHYHGKIAGNISYHIYRFQWLSHFQCERKSHVKKWKLPKNYFRVSDSRTRQNEKNLNPDLCISASFGYFKI